MASVHTTAHLVDGWVVIGGLGGALVLWHALRLAVLDDSSAERWLRARSFVPTPNQVRDVRAHLRRMRISRVVGAVAMLALAGISMWLAEVPIGVVTAPYLMSTLVAEVLAPRPRAPRERVASLAPRRPGYFAPRPAVLACRAVLLLGVVLTSSGLLGGTHRPAVALVHLAGTVAVLLLFERCLRAISARGLPQSWSDVQVDTALRVFDSRLACASALLYGAAALLLSFSISVYPDSTPFRVLLSSVMAFGEPAVLIAVVLLVSPQRSWYPPRSRGAA